MMNNLFSIFDPSTSILKMSWVTLTLCILLMMKNTWKTSFTTKKIMTTIMLAMKTEVSFSLKKMEKSTQNMILMVMMMILLLNSTALFPQVFSLTSQLTMNIPLSLTMWVSMVLFMYMKNSKHTIIHLLPQGTPAPLMMFMVIIEMISNMIRPITLCVRLTANLIAGHILMSLLGSLMLNINTMEAFVIIPLPLILIILEASVAFIQSYVFMTLITLYMTELK